ncbi:MAG: TetR/AcrR family transcriptional regulator [Halioglobus sp.]
MNDIQVKNKMKTADRILESATECFAQNGFERTNLRDIAQKVGIREPSIYRHFKSKEELYQKVLYQGLAPVADALLALSQRKMDPREMVEVPGMMLKLHSHNPHVASLLQQAVTMPSGQFENQLLEEWLSKLLDTGKQALMKADYNSVDEIDVSLRILNLFNLCIGYFTNGSLLERLCGMKPDDPEVLKRQERILHVTSKAWALSA